jgi:hypothetical protein
MLPCLATILTISLGKHVDLRLRCHGHGKVTQTDKRQGLNPGLPNSKAMYLATSTSSHTHSSGFAGMQAKTWLCPPTTTPIISHTLATSLFFSLTPFLYSQGP